MKNIVLALLASAAIAPACAQIPFLTIDSININKINASVLVHGDMWWNGNPSNYHTKGFFPNGTSKTFGGFGSAVWMSGYDAGGQLHVAAQTYRQDGNDYWPGPLTGTDTLTYADSHDWAKIWKINRSDIQYFLSLTAHTTSNTPPMILTWPGKGSSYARGNGGVALTVSTDMAPFVDVNANGIYEPLLGDYPDIKGDQALWWVFSDNGPAHSQSNGKPLKAEIHAMSYAYSRGTLIDNVVYYDYSIVNRSTNNYNNFRFGIRTDMDLGYFSDDYIGFDSSWRLGIQYNGISDDGSLGGYPLGSYGRSVPITGVTFVSLPGDAGSTYVPAGSFTYHAEMSFIGLPVVDTEYDHYLRAEMKNGQHFRNDFSSGIGPGPLVNYVYPGDPSDNTKWSECAVNFPFGNRRFILASNDNTLPAGGSLHYVLALVITDTGTHNACGDAGLSFTGIKTVADTAWKNYYFPPAPITSSISEVATTDPNIYPNPVIDVLHIAARSVTSISVINTLGQQMNLNYSTKDNESTIDVSTLSPGVYYCVVYGDGTTVRRAFVKQ